jgi:MFS family permease
MGLNEAAGYGAVAVTAAATGWMAAEYGLRPEPFLLGLAYAAIGLGLSSLTVQETRDFAQHEGDTGSAGSVAEAGSREVFALTTFREPALSAVSQAGLVNNLNDGLAWGLFPVLFAAHGLSTAAIGGLVALYPAVWGLGQLAAGPLSDRLGRKPLIVTGMLIQAAALASVASFESFGLWAAATTALGIGTAMVYPTLLAAIGDVAHPRWRASAVGVYRFWRDSGFAVGALLAGVLADAVSLDAAIWTVAALTAASGGLVAVRMYETHRPRPLGAKATAIGRDARGHAVLVDRSAPSASRAPTTNSSVSA